MASTLAIGTALPLAGGKAFSGGGFPLIRNGKPAQIIIDPEAESAVRHVAESFAADLERVCGMRPGINLPDGVPQENVVIIGVVGQSGLIDQLAKAGQIDVSDLHGAWEAFRHQVIDNPFPGVRRALVIAGSDRRGAVFGTYDISERMGVSPWYWFADVPVKQKRDVVISAESKRDQPKVRYRGFFINDEEPGFGGWARKKFGGFNAQLYAPIFELLLRLKGNYLWPAMWLPKAFADDDPANMVLADAMGVIMGNSHHEPMLRAQHEWQRGTEKGVTGGKWDYATNGANLRAFWRGGIERMMSKGGGQGYESLVTIGMRGDGDEAMTKGTAISLMEQIVADQRAIIADATGKVASATPQVWALYKEVQDYYDAGMQVPDDVTLLFSDDNWGQIRRLPKPDVPPRKGGYGIYYHFDYVGGPRNYRWLNTNQIEKTWQQMDLAWRRGAQALWIANVGDIKPMEFPLSFFMAMAWDPDAMTPAALAAYPAHWAGALFGEKLGGIVGDLLTRYSQYAAWRKPELVDVDCFALGHGAGAELDGGEFGTLVATLSHLERDMLATKAKLLPDAQDAWFQLVEHPIAALTTLYRLYYAVAWNRRLAGAGDPRANYFADQAEAEYRCDQQLTDHYHALGGGKWAGMMAQIHIGYTGWQEPSVQLMPVVKRIAGTSAPVYFAKPTPKAQGVIALEAARYSRAINGHGLRWTHIPRLGRTMGAMIAQPQGQSATSIADGVMLQYDVRVEIAGSAILTLYFVPTLDTLAQGGSRIAVSIDNGAAQTLTLRLEPTPDDPDTPERKAWARAVTDNVAKLAVDLGPVEAGAHSITLWRIDDNMAVQKLVLATVPLVEPYLGPPST